MVERSGRVMCGVSYGQYAGLEIGQLDHEANF